MSWCIEVLVNNVRISPECAKALLKATRDDIWGEGEVVRGGVLYFNPDYMEHMDCLWKEEVQTVLRNYKVKGDICFGSLDGDNAGEFWGYRFDGKGGMVELAGAIAWGPKPQKKRKK